MSASATRHPRTTLGTVLVLGELLCIALSAPLLNQASYFLGKLFGVLGPNDNNPVVYAVVAVVYAAPAVLLLALALVLRPRGQAAGPSWRHSRGVVLRRLAALTSGEWAWAMAVLATATVVWRLYLADLD